MKITGLAPSLLMRAHAAGGQECSRAWAAIAQMCQLGNVVGCYEYRDSP